MIFLVFECMQCQLGVRGVLGLPLAYIYVTKTIIMVHSLSLDLVVLELLHKLFENVLKSYNTAFLTL